MMLACWACTNVLFVHDTQAVFGSKDGHVDVHCNVCRAAYRFSVQQIKEPDPEVKKQADEARRKRMSNEPSRPSAIMLQRKEP